MIWPFGKRRRARQRRRFEAAHTGRLLADWIAVERSINQELRADLDKLRARSRDLAKNNAYAKRYLAMVVANVVGPNGFTLQSRIYDEPGKPDTLANDAIEAAWREWGHACDLRGQSFQQLCRQVIRAVARDGETLVFRHRNKGANRFGYALQHIDIERLDTQLNREANARQNAIIMGVEVDAIHRPVAYHLRSDNAYQHRVLSADDVLHLYDSDRADQTRGIPWMHASMVALHHLGEFEKSALTAARKGANTLGFFVSPDGEPPVPSDDASGEDPIEVSVEGSYDTLPDGYDFRPYQSQYPNEVFADFVKAALRRVASGLNVSYHTLANDLEGVNFSSIRTGVLEEREQWMGIQRWFIDAFLRPVFLEWLEIALMMEQILLPSGRPLPANKMSKFSAHQWQGRRWEWVDPLKDIKADIEAVNARLKAPQDIAAKIGLDYEDVLIKIKQAQDLAEQLGLTDGNTPIKTSADSSET